MDTRTIFGLLKHLTRQTSTQGLITSFIEILSANFSGVQLTVYELQATRKGNSKEQSLVCIDCIRESAMVDMSKNKEFYRSFSKKEIVRSIDASQKQQIVVPVELYDKSISHLIKVVHPYKEQNAIDLLSGLVEIFTDIFRSLHEKGYDPLTRIMNRQAFDRVASNLAYANKLPEQVNKFDNHSFSSIAIIDIDKFKSINDQFGHAIGDETLVLFAQTVKSVLRQDDMFFRYGGEEFVVFVKQVDNEQTFQVLERCRHEVENRRFPQVGQVTISIGYANLEPGSHPLESLTKADKALYYIKNNGRNQVKSYEDLVENNLMVAAELVEGSVDFWDE